MEPSPPADTAPAEQLAQDAPSVPAAKYTCPGCNREYSTELRRDMCITTGCVIQQNTGASDLSSGEAQVPPLTPSSQENRNGVKLKHRTLSNDAELRAKVDEAISYLDSAMYERIPPVDCEADEMVAYVTACDLAVRRIIDSVGWWCCGWKKTHSGKEVPSGARPLFPLSARALQDVRYVLGFPKVKPDGWPASVRYTHQLDWSGVDSTEFDVWHCRDFLSETGKYSDKTEIRRITQHGHPVSGKFGLFARAFIREDEYIMDYAGRVRICDVGDVDANESMYVASLDQITAADGRLVQIDVDAEEFGNETRFINDYRNVAPQPNVRFEPYHDLYTQEKRIGVVAARDIQAGEEVLVDYGDSYWDAVRRRNASFATGKRKAAATGADPQLSLDDSLQQQWSKKQKLLESADRTDSATTTSSGLFEPGLALSNTRPSEAVSAPTVLPRPNDTTVPVLSQATNAVPMEEDTHDSFPTSQLTVPPLSQLSGANLSFVDSQPVSLLERTASANLSQLAASRVRKKITARKQVTPDSSQDLFSSL